MLTDPPCLAFFIGCHGQDSFPSSDGSGTASSSRSAGGGRIGSLSGKDYVISHTDSTHSTGFSGGSLSSASSGPSGLSSSSASKSLFGKKPELFAVYDITLKNLSKNPLSGLHISHGPVPYGATFDAQKSQSGCSFLAKITGCSARVGAGEQTSFPIAYKVSNAAFCRLAPVLNSVKVAFDGSAQGSGSPAIAASVRCEVRSGSAFTALSSSANASAESNAQGGTVGTTSGMPSSSASASIASSSTQAEGVFENSQMIHQTDVLAATPRTGAEQQYYAQVQTSDIFLTKVSEAPALSVAPIFWLAFASFLLILMFDNTLRIR